MSRVNALDPALDGLEPTQSLLDAGRAVLEARFKAVAKLMKAARKGGASQEECIHQTRVATRRAAAALVVFESCGDPKAWKLARTALRRIRKAADETRRTDVHRKILLAEAESAPDRLQAGFRSLGAWVGAKRSRVERAVKRRVDRDAVRAFREISARVLDRVAGRGEIRPLLEAAAEMLPRLVGDLRLASRADLKQFENLHEMRLAGKRLRYAMEIFSCCLTAAARESLYPALKNMQDRLGAINDSHELAERIAALVAEMEAGRPQRRLREAGLSELVLVEIQRRFERQRQRKTREFLRWRRTPEAEALLVDLALAAQAPSASGQSRVDDNTGNSQPSNDRPHDAAVSSVPRFAAIDVGTNSIRLVIAEALREGGYRIIDDEKETTRLGGGLCSTGRLSLAAMKRSVRAIERMLHIAQAYHVDRMRAVATAAVREAANGEEFIELVEHRTGLRLELISAEHEARLAHASVASAFDLADRNAAVVDIGGGSTEIVVSSCGIIEGVHTLPLGGVRLSELFDSRPEEPVAFAAMRDHIDATLAGVIQDRQYQASEIIGTGGTFTTLAKIMLRRSTRDNTQGRLPFDLRGYTLSRVQVGALLAELRSLPLRERMRIPGISETRAEIIVEGIAIVDRVMARLNVDTLRIHDGGIRDGLLISMIEEDAWTVEGGPSMASGRLKQVRRFAESCRYDRRHAIQVSRVALRLFDQIAQAHAEQTWTGTESRDLLHMAALLHDVGCCIEYRGHHRHSHDLIMASKLRDFSRRELALIANIARYHRKSPPSGEHAAFARLSEADRELVIRLGGILRIADGLDRSHRQLVQGVRVSVSASRTIFAIECESEPAAEMRAAAKKSDLFQLAFGVDVQFLWNSRIRRLQVAAGGAKEGSIEQ